MSKQISFNYTFIDHHNEHNYFVNVTNVDAFNGLFKFDNNLFFYMALVNPVNLFYQKSG